MSRILKIKKQPTHLPRPHQRLHPFGILSPNIVYERS